MNFVAWQMLTGDRAKYLGLIFAIAFSSFLMSHQTSIFCGLMNRTTSQIADVRDAQIWVMDAKTQYVDEVKALTDQDLFRIRGVAGVEWAVPLYKALGSPDRLREPDSIIIDRVGFKFFFPGEPLELGKTFEMNDRAVRVAGIANSSAPFQNLPVFYARYSQAITYVGRERNLMSFVLVKPREGFTDAEVCARIEAATQLKAITADALLRIFNTLRLPSSTISSNERESRKSPTSTLAGLPNASLAVARPRRSVDSSTTSSCSKVAV